MAVDWVPIREAKSQLGEIADNSAWTAMELTLLKDGIDPFGHATILNGWLEIHGAMPDGTAMGGGYGPVEFILAVLPPQAIAANLAAEIDTVDGLWKWQDYMWYRTVGFCQGPFNVMHVRFDFNTMRRIGPRDQVVLYVVNLSDAMLGKAGTTWHVTGELYLRED